MAGWQDWGTDGHCKRHWSGESCSSGGWKAWSGWQDWAEGGGCKGEGDDLKSWPSNCWYKKNSWDSQVPREYCQEELDQDMALAGTTDASPDPVACKRAGPRVAWGDRLWCHIFLQKRHPEFDLVPILIGRSGRHMREINQATDAKVRVRGRGSRHLEVGGVQEAPVPLMVAITLHGAQRALFRTAVDMTISQLQHVQDLFGQFCEQRNLSEALMGEELWSFGEMSKDAEIVLADLLPEGCQLLVKEGHQISRRYAKRNKFSTSGLHVTGPACDRMWPVCDLHVTEQRGTARNGFNLLYALHLDAPQARSAEARFGSQMLLAHRAASGPASSLEVTKWDSSLPHSTAIVGDFSATAAATAAPPLQPPGLAASLCQQQREQSLAEQADDNRSECEADLLRRIASEVAAFLEDIT
jgi:hypothetical protein